MPAAAADRASSLVTFQAKEDKLFQVGYRLATTNAQFCDETELAPGFLIHDAESYDDADAVRTTFGLRGDIGIQAVAPGSPAARAGMQRNDTLLAVDGLSIVPHWPATKPGWRRPGDIRSLIEASLRKDGTVSIEWSDPSGRLQSATISGVPACRTRFELLGSSKSAKADGERVLVGERFPAFAYEDEAMFAAVVAHELAHNILRHPQTFIAIGRTRKLTRQTERDADRMMPWLLRNAGYEPDAAVRFMTTWGPKHGGWIFHDRSHDGWDERAEFIAAELPKIVSAAGGESTVDWKVHFETEFAPTANN